MSMSNVSVYIDGGPLTDGIRGQGMSMDLDWRALLQDWVAPASLGEVYYFVPQWPQRPYPIKRENQHVELQALQAKGVNVVLARTEVVGSVFVERGTEVNFATQLLSDVYARGVDSVLIISRRAELAPLLDAVRHAGARVQVAFFEYRLDPHNPLHDHCDEHRVLTVESIVGKTLSGPRPFFQQG